MDWKDIGNRAAWTFAQAFVAALAAVMATGVDITMPALWAAGLSAGAAALSVIKNYVVQKRG